eukprot:CAMPEP_0114351986 /NCGR_PEP_ID=MMETSP0101-20121206/17607_1 /TAXON_ID=38822 ORGANISM="Pteridomonas danica, Strain PT" /NCGR_SAMPLE_ID=MMETSP0101 /ASSEMBLY_ACC=CAM_ASM_000211 /LENGTH=254 /DNA_ID=CAMNT_0001492161 /DNA_START=1261 /DNA_END=2025 /DNA_ORIENTATION=-
MNVDNGIKIFRYNGLGPILTLPYEQLFDCQWRPANSGIYPDRPQSPQRNDPSSELSKKNKNKNSSSTSTNGSASTSTSVNAKPQAYRAPGSSGRLAAMMRADREGSGPSKLSSGSSGGGGVSGAFRGGSSSIVGMSNLPLGAAPPKETNTSKNKAKKDKKKKAIEADAAARAEMEKLKISSPSSSSVASTTEPQAPAEPVDKAKRLKKLEKSLKAIAGIKEKVAAGNEINADQKTKLSSEQDILTEIEQLNAEM